jgi:hypothetical protein
MKPISNKDKQIIKRIMKHKKQILLSFIILFMAVVLIDISPYGGQNLQLYAKWIECGHKPYKTVVSFDRTRAAHYTDQYSLVNLSFMNAGKTFCTPHEAELAGYSASSDKYIYPHLNAEERKWLDEQINKGNL